MFPAVLIGLLVWIFYKFWTSSYSYWEKRGYPFLPGAFPLGSDKNLTLLKKFQGCSFIEIYDKLAPHPYGGIYVLRNPVLFLRDPQIIKFVMVKEYSHFRARLFFKRPFKNTVSHHLFNLEGDEWRALRVKLTPTFTSGKLKAMFPLFLNCCQELESLLLSLKNSPINIKDVTTRFSLDVIGTCAFGLDLKTVSNPDSEFKKMGNEIFKKRLSVLIRTALLNAFPELAVIYAPRFTQESVEYFLLKLVKDAVEYREKNNLKLNDFLSLLMELKNKGEVNLEGEKEESIEVDMVLMAAQCYVFFAAGFETSSSIQSYCMYELALHPEIQQRLQNEIEEVIEKNGGLTYQAVQEMEYLDMVVSETMRKYPTLPLLTRRCTQKIVLPGGQELEEGIRVYIPVWALHHDPQYFPNPETFDPERFSPERKSSIVPFSYLPFGEGPRICIGVRFGLLQTKMGLITVLRKYNIEVTAGTMIPLKFRGTTFVTTTDGPITLKLTSRTQ